MTKGQEKLDSIAKIKAEINDIVNGKINNFIFRGENNIKNEKISSGLYREQMDNIKDFNLEDIELNFPGIQKEIIRNARKHFDDKASDKEVLTELQHYRGKTNLIDFSKNFLIALFFACDGETGEDGRLICFNKNGYNTLDKDIDYEKDFILESNSKNNRVIFQSSIFIYSKTGVIEVEKDFIITIKKLDKEKLLKELKQYHDIYTDTIYNDLHGFIANRDNYKTAHTYFYLGFYSNEEDYENAIKSYDKAIELKPNYADAYYNRGNAKYNLEEYKEAIADYDKAIELNPNFAGVYNNRGLARHNLGEYKEAIADYDKAIELNPNFSYAYNNRGLARENLGKYEEAIADYDKALKLDPKNERARINRRNAIELLK